jgi:hypothetical protein
MFWQSTATTYIPLRNCSILVHVHKVYSSSTTKWQKIYSNNIIASLDCRGWSFFYELDVLKVAYVVFYDTLSFMYILSTKYKSRHNAHTQVWNFLPRCKTWEKPTTIFIGKDCFIASNSTDLCGKLCPRIIRPVCGTNGVTYDNFCLLEVAACKNPQVSILLIHFGHYLQEQHNKGQACAYVCNLWLLSAIQSQKFASNCK